MSVAPHTATQTFPREIKAMLKSEPEPPELTERQRELLVSIVKGLSSVAIALRKHLLKM